MSISLVHPPEGKQSSLRKRFTRVEVQQMEDAGLFEGQRLELIEGDLIDKMGQKPPHAFAVRMIHALMSKLFGAERVQGQSPIEVQTADQPWSLPEPDVAVLREANPEFQKRSPNGPELLLVIEVADTSVRQDLSTKRDLYARAGVAEYWVLDLRRRRLIVHREPSMGCYASTAILDETEAAMISDVEIPVVQMLPDRS